jgi:hypothetical protein
VSPVKYELGVYIPEDDILHSDRRELLKFHMELSVVTWSYPPKCINQKNYGLADRGFDVDVANSGDEGLATLERQSQKVKLSLSYT